MIGSLTGRLQQKEPAEILVDVGGVGYRVHVPLTIHGRLPELGQIVQLSVHTHVREDSLSLYGFATREERDLFEKLIGVQGIGPRLALALLSHLGPSGLIEGVGSRDVDRFTLVPGIGRKSAERLILELGSALKGVAIFDVSPRSAASSRRADLHSALENLGYRAAQAAAAADAVLSDATPDEPFDSLLRRALKTMSAPRSVSEPAPAHPTPADPPGARRTARRRGA